MDKVTFIVGLPKRLRPTAYVPSVTRTCYDCTDDVWISKTSEEDMPDADVLCIVCMERRFEKNKDVKIGVTEKVLKETRDYFEREGS